MVPPPPLLKGIRVISVLQGPLVSSNSHDKNNESKDIERKVTVMMTIKNNNNSNVCFCPVALALYTSPDCKETPSLGFSY